MKTLSVLLVLGLAATALAAAPTASALCGYNNPDHQGIVAYRYGLCAPQVWVENQPVVPYDDLP